MYRVFHKGVAGTRKLHPVNENYIPTAMDIINSSPDDDYYESIYVYNDSHKEQLEQTKTLSGILDVKTDRVVFDFDSKSNVEQARLDASQLVDRLILVVPEEAIRIFTSGSKGFHVEVHLNQFLNRKEFENIIDYYAGDLATFDTKIKDQQRLFRFPLTRHQKSKRFKVPLSVEQLKTLSVEQIQKLSMRNDKQEFFDLLENYITLDLPEDFKKASKDRQPEKQQATTEVLDRPNLANRPKHLTPAKYVLQEGFFEEGERNEACMILASTYKYLGYDDEHTYNIIKATLRKRARRLDLQEYDKGELWNTIVKPVFSPTWKGGTFSEDDGLLKRTTDRYNLDKISIADAGLVKIGTMIGSFENFAKNIEANTIKLGIEEIDKKVRLTTGMLVAFLAAPGAGKSSLAFGLLNTLSNNNEKAIFFSMDMGSDQVTQRVIQRHTGHDSDRILKNFEKGVRGEIENYENVLNNHYKNIHFSFRTSMTPAVIDEAVVKEFQMTGSYPKCIVLDYLECIQTGINDPTQSKAVAALALKDIANKYGINVFLLTQPTKMAGGPAGELNSYTQIKGSGVVGEQATVVLTMSRPGFDPKHPEDDNFVTINVVKNRMGPLSSTDLHWNGLTGMIRSLSHEEENDLKALREAIAIAKSDDGDLY